MEADFSHVWQMWAVFAAIVAAIIAYASEEIPLEATSLALLAGLLLLFQVFPVEGPHSANMLDARSLLAGFADPALIAVLALLVIGQGLFQTGALEGVAQLSNANAAQAPVLTLTAILILILVVSSFMNNTPVAVIFIPVVSALAAKASVSSSKMMIPLSYASILGGMTTLIGSSTNLLAAGAAERAGLDGRIGFFDFTIPGLVLAGVGIVYVAGILPRFLPARANLTEEMGTSGKQFIAQLQLGYGHPLVGSKATGGLFANLKNMTVRMVQRGEHPFLPPFEDLVLRPGDTIIIAATRTTLTDALKQEPEIFQDLIHQDGGADLEGDDDQRPIRDLMLAETIIAPGSRLIGNNIEQAGFRMETECIVLGVQRRSRMIRSRMSDIRLEAGDVLLIVGARDNVQGLRTSRDLLLLEWSATEIPNLQNARKAQFILAGTVAAAAFGLLPIVVAAIFGAFAMIASGCLNTRQAARAIDRRIFMIVGTALALGTALELTGGAMYVAHQVIVLFEAYGTAVVLSMFFLLVAVMTNLLSNNATAVLFAPIAVSTANQLGVDPMAFVFAVILAANCSFATPMGYQTNLLVMGPGHYTFADFLRAGVPLVILLWLTFSLFAPWYYGV